MYCGVWCTIEDQAGTMQLFPSFSGLCWGIVSKGCVSVIVSSSKRSGQAVTVLLADQAG